jgi:hypothetical protein
MLSSPVGLVAVCNLGAALDRLSRVFFSVKGFEQLGRDGKPEEAVTILKRCVSLHEQNGTTKSELVSGGKTLSRFFKIVFFANKFCVNLSNLALAYRHSENLADAIANWERVKELRESLKLPDSADGGLCVWLLSFELTKISCCVDSAGRSICCSEAIHRSSGHLSACARD